MLTITAKDNQYIKLARSLGSKKGRDKSGCFLVEGLRLSEEALLAKLAIKCAFVQEQPFAPRLQQLLQALQQQAVPIYQLAEPLFSTISATCHSQGICLVAQQLMPAPLPGGGRYYALLDQIADPGNVGAIFRSAYAAGASGLLLMPGCADAYNPKVVRAAMGALFRLPFASFDSPEQAYQWAKEQGLAIYSADAGGTDIRELADKLNQPHLWVLGAEAQGISTYWQQHSNLAVSLPMRAGAESLNVAQTAAVIFYQSFYKI